LPLDGLPQDLKTKLGHEFDFWYFSAKGDWQKARPLANSRKDYFQICLAYYLLDKKDSAQYWARQALKEKGMPFKPYIYAFASDRAKAFGALKELYEKRIETSDDKMTACYKMLFSKKDLYRHFS